jgi:predicted aspartyl protease
MLSHCSRSSLFLVLGWIFVASVCLSAAVVEGQINLEVLKRDGYAMAPIRRPRPNDLIVSGAVNGRNVNLDLDTGWGAHGISLDSSFNGTLGVQAAGSKDHGTSASGKELVVRTGIAQSVSLGNAVIKGVPINFGVFKGLRDEERRRNVGADGFLGSGFLRTCSAIVDLHNLRLYLRPPGTGRRVALGPALKAAGMSEASFLQASNSNCFVDVEIDGTPAKMIIDTGATLSTVDHEFAAKMKTKGYRSELQYIDAAGATEYADRIPVQSFKIGGINARVPDLLLSHLHPFSATHGQVVGLMGMDILGQNWSIIDFGEQKLYFAGAK